jgi:hypothetical protein
MNTQRLAGIGLLVFSVILFTIGTSVTNAARDRWSHFFTGHFTNATVWYIVASVVLAVFGLLLVVLSCRKGAA